MAPVLAKRAGNARQGHSRAMVEHRGVRAPSPFAGNRREVPEDAGSQTCSYRGLTDLLSEQLALDIDARQAPDREDCIMTAERIAAMPAGPEKAEIMTFRSFLRHHAAPAHTGEPGSSICTCGVAARLEGEIVYAVPNPGCDCPCHQPGYVAK